MAEKMKRHVNGNVIRTAAIPAVSPRRSENTD